MKNLKLSIVSLIATLTLTASAAGGGNADPAAVRYVVKVSLSNQDGERGSLQVIDNQNGGRVLRTCEAIGGAAVHPDGAGSRQTPEGNHDVDETHVDLRYKAPSGWTWIRGVNATYFTDIHGRPVAVHTGSLNSNSHACVRTTEACSAYIMGLANSVAEAGQGESILGRPKRNYSMVVSVDRN